MSGLTVLLTMLAGCSTTQSQRLCENNDNPVATISPCEGPTGTNITVTPGRQLPSTPGTLVFKRVIANGVPAEVIIPISGTTVASPPQLCIGGNGRWEVWLVLANEQSQGKIGAFWSTGCVGGTSTGLGKSGGTNNNPPPKQLIILPPVTINVDNEVYVKTRSTSQSYIKNITSSVSEVATGTEWGTNDVKVRGKTPGITIISFLDANTGTIYQVEVTVKEPIKGGDGAIKTTPQEGGAIDQCLVGSWLATTVTVANPRFLGGGDGFRVTFTKDGDQSVDYSTMKPFQLRGDSMVFTGSATARISTKDKTAKIERMVKAGAFLHLSKVNEASAMPMPGIGPGGLGDTSGDNSYICTSSSLEYRGAMSGNRQPNLTIKLTRQNP